MSIVSVIRLTELEIRGNSENFENPRSPGSFRRNFANFEDPINLENSGKFWGILLVREILAEFFSTLWNFPSLMALARRWLSYSFLWNYCYIVTPWNLWNLRCKVPWIFEMFKLSTSLDITEKNAGNNSWVDYGAVANCMQQSWTM